MKECESCAGHGTIELSKAEFGWQDTRLCDRCQGTGDDPMQDEEDPEHEPMANQAKVTR